MTIYWELSKLRPSKVVAVKWFSAPIANNFWLFCIHTFSLTAVSMSEHVWKGWKFIHRLWPAGIKVPMTMTHKKANVNFCIVDNEMNVNFKIFSFYTQPAGYLYNLLTFLLQNQYWHDVFCAIFTHFKDVFILFLTKNHEKSR